MLKSLARRTHNQLSFFITKSRHLRPHNKQELVQGLFFRGYTRPSPLVLKLEILLHVLKHSPTKHTLHKHEHQRALKWPRVYLETIT